MKNNRLVIVEPNKVANQHNTFNNEFLKLFEDQNVHFIADKSTIEKINPDHYDSFEFINVIDGNKRSFIIKTFTEIFNVLKVCIKFRRNKILFLSISPQVLFLLEIIKFIILPFKKIWINLHGELEGIFEKEKQKINSYGFWIILWLKLRRFVKSTNIIILAEYIYESVTEEGYSFGTINKNIYIINLPIPSIKIDKNFDLKINDPNFLFIGQRSEKKGFSNFLSLQKKTKYLESYYSIGQGSLIHHLDDNNKEIVFNDYINAVSNFLIYVFPVSHGYKATISSALCDAIGCGHYIIAYKNPMTDYFQKILGEDFIHLLNSENEMIDFINNLNHDLIKANSNKRILSLNKSSISFKQNKKQAVNALDLREL